MNLRISTALVAVSLAGAALAQTTTFQVSTGTRRKIPAASLHALDRQGTKGRVSPDKKTLTFTSRVIRLVVHIGPSNDMMSFRIQELRNPKLVLPAGATLRILFVNNDEEMLHNLRFTARKGPFPAKMTNAGTFGSADLSSTAKLFTGQEFVVKVPTKKGAYTYVCTILGHAAAGMYGSLIAR